MTEQGAPQGAQQGAQGAQQGVRATRLTPEEELLVTSTSERVNSLLDYLLSEEADTFTDAQKDAFFYLGCALGLQETLQRFHPSVSDPCLEADIDTVSRSLLIFSNFVRSRNDAIQAAAISAAVSAATAAANNPGPAQAAAPGGRRSTLGGPFLPPLSSTLANPASGSASAPNVTTDIHSRLNLLESQFQAAGRMMNRSSFIPSQDDSDQLIGAPALGTGGTATNAIKAIRILMGHDKFSLEDVKLGSSQLKNLLPMVAQVIEDNKLNEANAYMCFLSILKGDLYTILSNQMQEKKPFSDSWRYVQLMAQGVYSREGIEKEIKKLLTTMPTSASQTFSRLQILYKNLYQHMVDPTKRAIVISTKLVEDINRVIAAFYPAAYPNIENLMEMQRNAASPSF